VTEDERAELWCQQRKDRAEFGAFLCSSLQPASEEPADNLNQAWMPVICFMQQARLPNYNYYLSREDDPSCQPQMGNWNPC
jgi:hypothetical protein